MTLQELLAMLQGQKPQPTTVRPDYGLTGAMISAQRSPYERTLAPGEQRSAEGLQDMLAEVIMAAGSAAIPGVQGQPVARRAPGMRAAIDQGILSPNGRVSERAREQALERVRVELFGESGLQAPTTPQPSQKTALLRQAAELRDLASRGMKVRAYTKKAEELERMASEMK